MDLSKVSVGELLAEITRRNRALPTPLERPDTAALERICAGYVKDVIHGNVDDDAEHYIFEEALQCIYGTEIFSKLYSPPEGKTNMADVRWR